MTIYAEDVNYWRSGQRRTVDKWLELAVMQIENLGGEVFARGVGKNEAGKESFLIGFKFEGESYKVIWPVLPTRGYAKDNDRAARVRAVVCYNELV